MTSRPRPAPSGTRGAAALHGLPDPVRESAFYDGVALKRGVAWLLDIALIAILSALVVPFTAFAALFFFPFLMLVLGFLYRWATLAGGSATLGMRLMGIEIREHDGRALTGTTAFLHTLGYTLSIAFAPVQVISVILMLVTGRGQGVTDIALGTAAINRPG